VLGPFHGGIESLMSEEEQEHAVGEKTRR
jgi:hypothetical protein